jgi:ribonuclease HI
MTLPRRPHYLLFAESHSDGRDGRWRFTLSRVGGRDSFAAGDVEPIRCRERLELLALVRGLEALDEPARVTLITSSRYVNRGLKHGLGEWRHSDWQWERFGQLVPVRDRDLWRRVDRALEFHELDCRLWRFDLDADAAIDAGEMAPQFTDHPPERLPHVVAHRSRSAAAQAWNEPAPRAELAAG